MQVSGHEVGIADGLHRLEDRKVAVANGLDAKFFRAGNDRLAGVTLANWKFELHSPLPRALWFTQNKNVQPIEMQADWCFRAKYQLISAKFVAEVGTLDLYRLRLDPCPVLSVGLSEMTL